VKVAPLRQHLGLCGHGAATAVKPLVFIDRAAHLIGVHPMQMGVDDTGAVWDDVVAALTDDPALEEA